MVYFLKPFLYESKSESTGRKEIWKNFSKKLNLVNFWQNTSRCANFYIFLCFYFFYILLIFEI